MKTLTTEKLGRAEASAYVTVAAKLRRQIAEQKLAPGAKLPSLRALASDHGVSLATMQSAIRLMESNGELVSEASRGVFVTERAPRSTVLASRKTRVAASSRGNVDPCLQAITSDAHIGIVVRISQQVESGQWPQDFSSNISRSLERSVCAVGASTTVRFVTDALPVCPDAVNSYLGEMVDAGADAIVLVSLDESGEIDSLISRWDQGRTPVVLIGAVASAAIVPQVHYDSRQAAQQAARHLFAKGCQSLAFFTAWPTRLPWVTLRIEGTTDAMRLYGKNPNELSIWGVDRDIADTEEADADTQRSQIALEYLTRGPLPDGIVASNDYGALAIMSAAAELGLVPGRDFLLIGFDDVEKARASGLTTMRRPAEEMGTEGGRLVMQTLGGVRAASRVCVNSHLVVRETTRWGLHGDSDDASDASESI